MKFGLEITENKKLNNETQCQSAMHRIIELLAPNYNHQELCTMQDHCFTTLLNYLFIKKDAALEC